MEVCSQRERLNRTTGKMKGKSLKRILMAVAAAIILYVFWSSISQKGPQDLSGAFQETAFVRNENNTGPVRRLYAVTVKDTLWQEMEQYGNFMPHTKYGTTKVFFFLQGNPAPTQLFSTGNPFPFDKQLKEFCLGYYEKDAMGQVKLVKKPFALKAEVD